MLEEGGTAAEVEEARAVAVAVAEAMVDGVPGEQTVAVAQEVAVEVAQAAEDANLEEGEAAAAVADAASALGGEAAVLEAGGDAAAAEALAAAEEGEVEQIVVDKVRGVQIAPILFFPRSIHTYLCIFMYLKSYIFYYFCVLCKTRSFLMGLLLRKVPADVCG